MNKKMHKPLLITGAFLILCLTSCNGLFTDQETPYPRFALYSDIRSYTYDPETILIALARGDEEIFQHLPHWGEEVIFQPASFEWQQQDFLKIVNGFNRVANEDTLEGWSVFSINSSRECADNPIGFDNFSITYFKTNGERYVTREIVVKPLAKEIDWAGNMNFPRPLFFGWKSIDLEKLKITTDDALQLAEENGGKAARQAVNNDCNILVALAPNAEDTDWGVYYVGGGQSFQIRIDPYNGKLKSITP